MSPFLLYQPYTESYSQLICTEYNDVVYERLTSICHCVGIQVQIDNKVDTRQILVASWGEPEAYHHAV